MIWRFDVKFEFFVEKCALRVPLKFQQTTTTNRNKIDKYKFFQISDSN